MTNAANHEYDAAGNGACCTKIAVSLESGIIQSVQFFGGCDGNHEGIQRLVCGRPAVEVIALLKGTTCHGSVDGSTSCPDQLALALQEAVSVSRATM